METALFDGLTDHDNGSLKIDVDLLKIEPIDCPTDPERCQGKTSLGACPNKGAYSSNGGRFQYCRIHGGAINQIVERKEGLENYRLARWNGMFADKARNEKIKSLKDEIAILRGLLQEKLEACQNTQELIIASGPLSDLILKIQKVVESCHRIDVSTGQMLDRTQVLQFAAGIISVITNVIGDQPDKIAAIANAIDSLLSNSVLNETGHTPITNTVNNTQINNYGAGYVAPLLNGL